jgi:hypothetical protein
MVRVGRLSIPRLSRTWLRLKLEEDIVGAELERRKVGFGFSGFVMEDGFCGIQIQVSCEVDDRLDGT